VTRTLSTPQVVQGFEGISMRGSFVLFVQLISSFPHHSTLVFFENLLCGGHSVFGWLFATSALLIDLAHIVIAHARDSLSETQTTPSITQKKTNSSTMISYPDAGPSNRGKQRASNSNLINE